MKKIYIILNLVVISLVGCSKSDSLEKKFFNNSEDCWVEYSQSQPDYAFWRFNKDHSSDNLERDEKGNLETFNIDGDLVIGPKKWYISSDSILSWGMHKYDVVNANEKVIILMYEENKTHEQGYIFLVKEDKSTFRKGANYFYEKRLKNPKKYISNN
jgi:hypothetical protein